tara:strand:+ start:96 stop:311 length:216 start_codon:yes stop_codon:yes gene_type:complete
MKNNIVKKDNVSRETLKVVLLSFLPVKKIAANNRNKKVPYMMFLLKTKSNPPLLKTNSITIKLSIALCCKE